MKRLLLVLLIGIFMFSFTSAYFEFDNYYNYDESTRTATFRNGLTFGSKIADIKLNTPLNMRVAAGYNYVFELEMWGDVDYSDFVRGIYVHDKRAGYGLVNRDIDLKYFNGYETKYRNINGCISEGLSINGTIECKEYGVIDTEEYQVEVWDNLLPRDLKQNDHLIIRGYTNVEVSDKMEWYIDFFGAGKNTGHGTKGIKEWAEWTADLNVDIISFYKLNQTVAGPILDSAGSNNGTNNGADLGVAGIINNSYDLSDNADYLDMGDIMDSDVYTANFWMFPGSFFNNARMIQKNVAGASGFRAFEQTGGAIRYEIQEGGNEYTIDTATGVLTTGTWNMITVLRRSNNSAEIYVNGISKGSDQATTYATNNEPLEFGDSRAINIDAKYDEIGIWNRSLSQTEITQLYNGGSAITFTNDFESIEVTLNEPPNDTTQGNGLVEFNWTITPTALNITNWTLSVFHDNGTLLLEEINTTINTDLTTTVLHNETIADGNYVWNVESCGNDVGGTCDLSGNRTFSIDTLSPLLNITSPVDGFIVTDALENITINFTINDSGGVLDQCWLNTSLNSTPNFIVCADNVTTVLYPASSPDNVTIFLSANDTAGNTGITNVTVFKNTVPPVVNITAPDEGFVVTQFNQSIDLNWSISDNATLDSCFYTFLNNGVNVSDDKFTDNISITDVGFFNYSTNNFVSGLSGLGDISFEKIFPGGKITLFSLSTNTAIGWSGVSNNSNCLNQTFSSKPITPLFGNEGKYFCVLLNDSTIVLNKVLSTAASVANLTWVNYPTTTLVDVNCSDNTTTINYPENNRDNFTITFFSNDTFGNLGSDNVTIFKSQVAPTINITAPADNFSLLLNGQSLDLNFTMTNSTELDTCIFLYNGVNTSATCEQSVSTTFTYIAGINTITVFVNDTLSNLNSSTQTWTVDAIENNITFNATTFETKTESFITNLSINASTVVSVSSILNYNGTRFTAASDCSGDICLISTAIDIPLIQSVVENESREWFYEVTVFSATSTITTNTTISTQNVTRIHLEICNATFTNQTLNFTAFDEQTEVLVNPFLFNGDFEFWLGTGSNFRNVSFEQPSVASVQLCILPGDENYRINGNVEYDEATGSNYTVRNYFFQNDTINATSQDIGLGLLLSSASTSFILKIQDADILPLAEALIFTERFYPGTGLFRVVQVGKTDDNGKTVGFFEAETGDYRFIIKKDGTTLLITPSGDRSQKVVGEETPFTLTFTVGEDEGASWEDFEDPDDLSSTLIFNISTQIVTFTYEDTSDDFDSALLQVFRLNASGTDSLLCNESLTQSSGLLTCNMTGNSTGSYIAKGIIFRDGTRILSDQIGFEIQDFAEIAGRLGLFLGWFIILIAALSFKFNEIAGIILTNAAMIFVNLIGLINFGITWITAWIALSIMLVVVLER